MPDLHYLRLGGADVWLFMGITLLVIAQIFKKGIEIQNDLTVHTMPIIVNLDVRMAKRKMSLNELSEKVELTLSNLFIRKYLL